MNVDKSTNGLFLKNMPKLFQEKARSDEFLE